MEDSLSLLYIDDEFSNLRIFEAIFAWEYKIFTAESAQEGLELLKKEDSIAVVIVDQRMPEMTGLQFLEQIISLYPDVVRIILTGLNDTKTVIDAVNKGQVFRFFTKPWNQEELKVSIDHAFDKYRWNNERNQLVNNLSKVNKELDTFLYQASHDLQGPLASLRGLTNLVKLEKKYPDKIEEYTQQFQQSITRMERAVDKLNALHYINFHETNFNGTLNANQYHILCAKVIEELTPLINEFGVEVDLNCNVESSDLKDFELIEMIMVNLLENAICFSRLSKNKKVYLTITLEAGNLVIKVEDNGIGIPLALQSKVFDMSFRGSEFSIGSGLGLYLVQKVVNKLCGKINLESEEEKGTKVTVSIPL